MGTKTKSFNLLINCCMCTINILMKILCFQTGLPLDGNGDSDDEPLIIEVSENDLHPVV